MTGTWAATEFALSCLREMEQPALAKDIASACEMGKIYFPPGAVEREHIYTGRSVGQSMAILAREGKVRKHIRASGSAVINTWSVA